MSNKKGQLGGQAGTAEASETLLVPSPSSGSPSSKRKLWLVAGAAVIFVALIVVVVLFNQGKFVGQAIQTAQGTAMLFANKQIVAPDGEFIVTLRANPGRPANVFSAVIRFNTLRLDRSHVRLLNEEGMSLEKFRMSHRVREPEGEWPYAYVYIRGFNPELSGSPAKFDVAKLTFTVLDGVPGRERSVELVEMVTDDQDNPITQLQSLTIPVGEETGCLIDDEVCDGADNDCNGEVDEAAVCNSAENCGQFQQSCVLGEICDNGLCRLQECQNDALNPPDCNSCPEGKQLVEGQCRCVSRQCPQDSCGTMEDGCGNFLECGSCAPGSECQRNECIVVRVDSDGDDVEDEQDNCDFVANGAQSDSDGDGIGNVCDNCPAVANPPAEGEAQTFPVDSDDDGTGDACEVVDVCGDGRISRLEACDDGNVVSDDGCSAGCFVERGYQCAGQPSACRVPDSDEDGIEDGFDNCPNDANAGQEDADGDALGDICDALPCGEHASLSGGSCVCDRGFVDRDNSWQNGCEVQEEREEAGRVGLLGDVNNDGSITNADSLLVRHHILGRRVLSAEQQERGDVNYCRPNGAGLTNADSLFIQRKALNIIERFPCE